MIVQNENAYWQFAMPLFAKGFTAFPQLITHIDDCRYSYTDHMDSSAVNWMNRDVGGVCYNLITTRVDVFHPMIRVDPMRLHLVWVPVERKELEAWWRAHQDMSLHDIQLEGAKWALDETRNLADKEASYDKAMIQTIKNLEDLVGALEASSEPIERKLEMPLKD